MSFLINFVTFVLCASILAFGGYKTVQEMDIEKITDDFQTVIDNAVIFPEEKPDDSETPGGSTEEKPDDSETPGGDIEEEPEDKPEETPTLSTEKAQETFKNLYDNHDSAFTEMKTEMLAGMISGAINLGSGSNSKPEEDTPVTPPEVEEEEEEEEEEDFDFDFDVDLDEEYVPEEKDEEEKADDELNSMLVDVTTIYSKNLLQEMDAKKEESSGLSEEESAAVGEEFVNKEVEALTGLITIVNNASSSGEAPEDEKIIQSVDAIIGSEVCLNTVTQSTETSESFVAKAQEATQNISEETIFDIKDKLNSALLDVQNSDMDEDLKAEKEKQYSDLANLFNITLGEGVELPDFNFPG